MFPPDRQEPDLGQSGTGSVIAISRPIISQLCLTTWTVWYTRRHRELGRDRASVGHLARRADAQTTVYRRQPKSICPALNGVALYIAQAVAGQACLKVSTVW
jgi:hypothetical protein